MGGDESHKIDEVALRKACRSPRLKARWEVLLRTLRFIAQQHGLRSQEVPGKCGIEHYSDGSELEEMHAFEFTRKLRDEEVSFCVTCRSTNHLRDFFTLFALPSSLHLLRADHLERAIRCSLPEYEPGASFLNALLLAFPGIYWSAYTDLFGDDSRYTGWRYEGPDKAWISANSGIVNMLRCSNSLSDCAPATALRCPIHRVILYEYVVRTRCRLDSTASLDSDVIPTIVSSILRLCANAPEQVQDEFRSLFISQGLFPEHDTSMDKLKKVLEQIEDIVWKALRKV